MGRKVDDEDREVLILKALPKAYNNFVDTIKYAIEKLMHEEFLVARKSKPIESQSIAEVTEGLVARGRSDHRVSNKD